MAIMTAIAAIFKGSSSTRQQKQQRQHVSSTGQRKLVIDSKFPAQSFADVLKSYMEGNGN